VTRFHFMCAGALAALAQGLSAPPAQAQDRGGHGLRGGGNAERVERQAEHPRQSPGGWSQREARASGGERAGASPRHAPTESAPRGGWGAAPRPSEPFPDRDTRAQAPVAATAPSRNLGHGADRNVTYSAPRDRGYGATTRGRGWTDQPHARDGAARQPHPTTGRSRPGGHGNDGRAAGWQGGRGDAAHGQDWRGDSRWGQDHPRWDNRGWRSDNRYDWYRHRASNRSLFSLGRYYAPHRGYSYSRIGIGFRLGSPFYSNRYWIDDPWQYRLPDVYGPYRWVRYYDDALLVDIYSGEVVDAIHDFFW